MRSVWTRLVDATIEKETRHTLSLVEPHLDGCSSFLDVGCGEGRVADELSRRRASLDVWTVDIGDFRSVRTPNFRLYDGTKLPFSDGRFDLLLLAFVLHHVPDVMKPLLLLEARRVARRIVVVEDTPVTGIDRFFSQRHGESYRRKIGSDEPFGFLTFREWSRLFDKLDLRSIEARPLSRLCRSALQPFARSLFVLEPRA